MFVSWFLGLIGIFLFSSLLQILPGYASFGTQRLLDTAGQVLDLN